MIESGGALEAARSSALIAQRNLLTVWREPGAVVANILASVVLVLLFAFVIGGGLGGVQYREYLMPGLFGQAAAFVVLYTTVDLATDLDRGVVDRFRSLPIARPAVILGRCGSDAAIVVANLAVLVLCGFAIGWTTRSDIVSMALALVVTMLFAFAMSWIGAYIALSCRRVQVAQSVGVMWVFPFTFVSSALVSPEFMVEPLRTIALLNPLSALCDTLRLLLGNQAPPGYPISTGWVVDNAALYCVLWSIGLVAAFGVMTVRRYRRLDRR